MITGAQLAPYRDRLKALVDAAQPPQPPPVIVPAGEPPLFPWEIEDGMTRTVFFDDFDNPATIDRDNAFTDAFKWHSSYYVDARTGITMNNSILRIAHDPGNGGSHCLDTMYVRDGEVRGWGYKGEASISVCMAFDPFAASVPGSRSCPAFWSLAKEHYQIALEQAAGKTCARADGSNPRHVELDYFEGGLPFPMWGAGLSLTMALNAWECNTSLSRKYPTCDWGGGIIGGNPDTQVRPPGYEPRERNWYTTRKKFGSLQRYITRPGQAPWHCSDVDHVWDTNDPVWGLIDSQTYPLILGACASFPADFDWVCVRQAPPSS